MKTPLRALIVVGLLLFAFPAWAKPVQEREALQVAEAWLHANPTPGIARGNGHVWKAKSARHFRGRSGDLVAYVVDLDPAGYLVVPADDTAEPVISFSASGSFDATDSPCNHLARMLEYDIPACAREHDKAPKEYRDKLAEKWGALKKAGESLQINAEQTAAAPAGLTIVIQPIVKTQWNQSGTNDNTNWSYDLYTPNHYLVGCVATAMAQIIRHHAYPTRARGTDVPYWICNWTQGSDSFDSVYDYSLMPDKLEPTTPTGQVQQVAKLSYNCGLAVNMNYCSDGSGTDTEDVATALTKYFRYKSAQWMGSYNWSSTLMSELSAGYPVEMAIRSSDDTGHAIVCDGYGYINSTYYYHLNMGWGGTDDNWYTVPGFSAGGAWWPVMRGFVYNIRPGDNIIRVKKGTTATDPNGTSWDKAYPSIGEALKYAAKPNNIWVTKGWYSENLVVPDGVSLFGGFASWETDIEQRNPSKNVTTIDGCSKGTAVYMQGSSEAWLDGFTIKFGTSGGSGGCVYAGTPLAVIRRNIITGGRAPGGGGIYCKGSAKVIGNAIYANSSTTYGGGIYASGLTSSAMISNNTIFSNSAATNGGGITFVSAGSPIIGNNIIAYNSSGGIYATGTLNLIRNDVYGNTSYNYLGVSAGSTDIAVDPLIAVPSVGNFHILPGSPCINAGSESALTGFNLGYDLDWQNRRNGAIDIGADESFGETYNTVIRVKQDSATNGPGTTWDNAYHTIGAAIAAAGAGSEIWVAANANPYYERIAMLDRVSLFGGFAGNEMKREDRNPAANVTIIDGSRAGVVVTMTSIVTSATTFDGFTIQNGSGGCGGIYCYGSPTISNNIITSNTGTTDGGGILLSLSSSRVENNIIKSNSAGGSGGGVHINRGSVTLVGNAIYANTGVKGGGISVTGSGTHKLTNNTICGNTGTTNAGGIYCESSASVTICNNIVAFNSSGIYKDTTAILTLANNNLYSNTLYQYSGLSAGTGDINADPMFANRLVRDYHIRSASPCRNAGLSTAGGLTSGSADMDGQVRIEGTTVDIGADESYGEVYSVIYKVKYNSSQNGPGDSWARAWRSLSSAVTYAVPGDEIWVAAGTYSGNFTINGAVGLYGGFAGIETARVGRNMRLNQTVLSGGSGNVLILRGPGSAMVEGFTITGGEAELGAGIWCRDGATPTINASIITGNRGFAGAGIACTGSDAVITNNIISANNADGGAGGILAEDCSPRIVNNVVTGNTGFERAGAMQFITSSAIVHNNIVTSNSPGIYTDGGVSPRYNCFYQNKGFDLSGTELHRSNIRTSPLFVNAAAGDYHLATGSPCLERGYNTYAPAADKDGFVRPQDSNGDGAAACDIGAYEATADLAKCKYGYEDGVDMCLGNVAVSAVFADEGFIYVEKPDRSAGIRVYTDGTFSVNQIVNISGTIGTSLANVERAIWAKDCVPAGGTYRIRALGMPVSLLGGGSWGAQKGVEQGVGLNNTGLLARVTGKITDIGDYYATLNDGSGVPVRVHSPVKLTVPITVKYVSVTGVISCGKRSDGSLFRIIRPRDISDITIY